MMYRSKMMMYAAAALTMAANSGCEKLASIGMDIDPRGDKAYGITYVAGQKTVYFNQPDSINAAIQLANTQNVPVYVHEGNYETLVSILPQSGFIGQGTLSYNNALIYSASTDFVGIPHNLEEQTYTYPNLITSGHIIAPPLALPTPQRSVDILASFYNDFGLQSKALAANYDANNGAQGWYGWYDWRWNFTTNPNYDPARHPLLGWYRGDEPNVLDWTCYWLVKYGVKGAIITNNFRTTDWHNASDKYHWIYQLFNNVPNFNQLKYSVWLTAQHSVSETNARAMDQDMLDNILAEYDNVYCHEVNGKRYPVFYTWDMEAFRGIYDNYNGVTNSVLRLKELAVSCKALGYDGICIYGRKLATIPGFFSQTVRNDLEANDVYLFSQEYSGTYNATGFSGGYTDYADYANNAPYPTTDFTVLNVMTGGKTQAPHGSGWNLSGTTPALFKTALQRAVDTTLATNKPKAVVVYNVSEWAEGGPGLMPNQQDLYGYLEAVRDITY